MRATVVLTETLLLSEMPGLRSDQARRTAEETAEQVAALPAVTRWGVRLAEATVLAAVAPLRKERRGAALGRLERLGVPGASEYVRLVRGVALVAHHERLGGGG